MLHGIVATSLLMRRQAQSRRVSARPADTTVSPRDIAASQVRSHDPGAVDDGWPGRCMK